MYSPILLGTVRPQQGYFLRLTFEVKQLLGSVTSVQCEGTRIKDGNELIKTIRSWGFSFRQCVQYLPAMCKAVGSISSKERLYFCIIMVHNIMETCMELRHYKLEKIEV